MKRLKCPECGELLESVERYNDCVEYADVCITEDGKEVETNVYNDSYGGNGYRCPECSHEDALENFIIDSETCEHVEAQEKYFEYGVESNICYRHCTECHCILEVDC